MRSLTAAELQREAEGRRVQQEQRREVMANVRQMMDTIAKQEHPLTEAQQARWSLIRQHQSEIYDLDTDIELAKEDLRRLEQRRVKLAEELTAMGVKVSL